MTTYEQLKEIIVKTVPEILELKFGCKVFGIIGLYTSSPRKISGSYIEKSGFGQNMVLADEDKTIRYFNNEETEILGRNITLEDVLRVLRGKNYEDKKGSYTWSVDMNGEFSKLYFAAWSEEHLQSKFSQSEFNTYGMWKGIFPTWQLGLSLHKQSEEVQQFILNILKP